jgi:hypothetical protein
MMINLSGGVGSPPTQECEAVGDGRPLPCIRIEAMRDKGLDLRVVRASGIHEAARFRPPVESTPLEYSVKVVRTVVLIVGTAAKRIPTRHEVSQQTPELVYVGDLRKWRAWHCFNAR